MIFGDPLNPLKLLPGYYSPWYVKAFIWPPIFGVVFIFILAMIIHSASKSVKFKHR